MSKKSELDEEQPSGRIRKIARRLLDEQVSVGDAKLLVGQLLEGSDRAKSEIVKAVGRELRTTIEGMGLQEDLRHLIENYSLEINASFRLKPLEE